MKEIEGTFDIEIRNPPVTTNGLQNYLFDR